MEVSYTNHTRHVLLALTGGGLIFLTAGGRLATLRAKVIGAPEPDSTEVVAGTLAGWAVMTLILVFASEIEPVAPLATGFAWLIFLGIFLLYGGDASRNILALMGQQPSGPPPTAGTHIGGR